jgi:16S rRNA processing protein RimM
MKKDECFELGTIVRTHALKGEIMAHLDVDKPSQYAKLDSLFVEIKQKLVPFLVERINVQQDRAIIKFDSIDRLEDAHTLLHHKLFLPLSQLPKAPKGTFYLHDLIGYAVEDLDKGLLGIITEIYDGSHQDILAMQYLDREVLIPLVDSIVLEAIADLKTLKVRLPEGLLELYLTENQDKPDTNNIEEYQ